MIPALAALYRRAPMGMRLGLGPMREACARAGHPERELRVVHVAGTNGKGSVCAMVEAIARAGGLRTGLYTSPHLCRFAERIRIDGAPVSDERLSDALSRALELGPELSFFETATLAALLALRDAKVDLAILEVGLGGRLDATNVVPKPLVAAITRIALDHTELLGDTVDAIAREKAAIAKPGIDLLCGALEPSVMRAVEETCKAAGARVIWVSERRRFDLRLAGDHQIENANIAHAIAKHLGFSDDACRAGFTRVDWPGRLETIETKDGPVLLDAAHNPDGARALARAIAKNNLDPSRVALIFGTLVDKAWPDMLDVLAPLAAHRTYVAPRGRAAADPVAMARRHAGETAPDARTAYTRARGLVKDGWVIACGSIYLIGELRAELLGIPPDPPVAL